MQELFLINKSKINKILLKLIIILFVVSLFPAILISSLTFFERFFLIVGITFLAPIFLILIAYITENFNNIFREKLYSNILVKEFLKENNFINYTKNVDEKWNFNHISKTAIIDEFYVGCDYELNLKRIIKIEIFLKSKIINKENLDFLYTKMDKNSNLTFSSLVLNFQINELNIIIPKIKEQIAILKKCDFETKEII